MYLSMNFRRYIGKKRGLLAMAYIYKKLSFVAGSCDEGGDAAAKISLGWDRKIAFSRVFLGHP